MRMQKLNFGGLTGLALASMVAPAIAVEPHEVARDLEPSIVRILVMGPDAAASGSGFQLNGAGHVATNYHIIQPHVEADWEIFVVRSGAAADGDRLAATLVKGFPNEDLAILQVQGLEGSPATLSEVDKEELAKGMPIYSIGYPVAGRRLGLGGEPSFTSGAMSRSIVGSWMEGSTQIRIIQHSAPTNPGNSGGPVANACGQVVGINSQRELAVVIGPGGLAIPTDFIQGVFFASHVSVLIQKLNELGIPYTGSRKACLIFMGVASTNWYIYGSALAFLGITLFVLLLFRPRTLFRAIDRCRCAAQDGAKAIARVIQDRQ